MASYVLTGQPHLAAIEYPGPIKDASVGKALASVGGLKLVSRALDHSNKTRDSNNGGESQEQSTKDTQTKSRTEIELSLSAQDPFHHPVQGNIARSANVVLKLVKRRRKQPLKDDLGTVTHSGTYSVQLAGIVTQTVRFRAMADFQYRAPTQDPMTQLALDLKKLDANALQAFSWPEPSEEYEETAFLPPPRFCIDAVPKVYDYRQATGVGVAESSYSAPGQEDTVTRLANLTRRGTSRIKSVAFDSGPSELPMPVDEDDAEAMKKAYGRQEYTVMERKLIELLQERPVWTRTGLLNQLSEAERRQLKGDKTTINNVTYTFSDGPWATLLIKPGYDPRTDPQARFYQNLAFRNIANVRQKATARSEADRASREKIVTSGKTELAHTFDGRVAHSPVGNFQLCDISDHLSRTLIQSLEGVLDEPTKDDGWWDSAFLEQIRQIVKVKFNGAVKGHVVSDFDCQHLLGDPRIGGPGGGAEAKAVKIGRKKGKGKRRARDEESTAEETESSGEEDQDEEEEEEEEEKEEDDDDEEQDDQDEEMDVDRVQPAASTSTTRRKSALPRVAMPWEKKTRKKSKEKRAPKKPQVPDEERQFKLRQALRRRGESAAVVDVQGQRPQRQQQQGQRSEDEEGSDRDAEQQSSSSSSDALESE
ncbi:hypothetical protein ACM66B_000909 [Microbotryomycetes sp. NB124-2]